MSSFSRSISFSRVLLRHPRLRVVLAESALSWGMLYMEWADHQFDHDGLAREGYELKPSEMFHRGCFLTSWFDEVAPFLPYVGADQFSGPASFRWRHRHGRARGRRSSDVSAASRRKPGKRCCGAMQRASIACEKSNLMAHYRSSLMKLIRAGRQRLEQACSSFGPHPAFRPRLHFMRARPSR